VTAAALPLTPAELPKLFPLRQSTGTARFHLSTDAVGFGLEDLEKLSEKDAIVLMAKMRWGSATLMPCPHCGTIDTHYWAPAQRRWKCKGCGKRFSVTSATVFADHKLTLVKILKMAFSLSNGAAGVPALKLRRDWNVAYATAFTLAHKVREGFLRYCNTGLLAGVHEMDGMDVNGRRYKEKRNKPQGSRNLGAPKVPEHLLKPPEGQEPVGPPKPHKFDKKARQPAERRIMLVLSQRGVSDGKGASATRVAVALTESSKTVTALAKKFGSAESTIISDEDPSYAAFSGIFAEHKTINHSIAYSDGNGVSNNQAESHNARMRRLLEGTYTCVSNKYLSSYVGEAAWRTDTRKLSTLDKLNHLFRCALSVGHSLWFRGYTHGHHREDELLIEGSQPAPGRGRPPDWKPKVPR
jgi:transposase-like protein